jgi:hypothetical protein
MYFSQKYLLNAVNNSGDEGYPELTEALKSDSSIKSLKLNCNQFVAFCAQLITGHPDDTNKMIKLFERLKSHTSLALLDLNGAKFVSLFHSHSLQGCGLILKELSSYPKHSNSTHHSHASISTVPNLSQNFISPKYRVHNWQRRSNLIIRSTQIKFNSQFNLSQP